MHLLAYILLGKTGLSYTYNSCGYVFWNIVE